MRADTVKSNGIHYTPPELAEFLAQSLVDRLPARWSSLKILDPACGNGGLLRAIAGELPASRRADVTLVGCETDSAAVDAARENLSLCGVGSVIVRHEDFLESISFADSQRSLFDEESQVDRENYDIVIANPPYVRTQVLGATRSQSLAKAFGLTGRVDLYHAFVIAMSQALRPDGLLGLLTSNRFLSIRSGAALRRLLRSQFQLLSIHDLGDTRLFKAAVLPAIVIAKKSTKPAKSPCRFDRVYEHRSENGKSEVEFGGISVLNAVRDVQISGLVETPSGTYRIERGSLLPGASDETWTLTNPEYNLWLETVRAHQAFTFDELGRIRVGIKSTADSIFIRDDWDAVPGSDRPENALLRPLIRHTDAERWSWSEESSWSVLYPHENVDRRRQPIELQSYPRAHRYLEAHRTQLENRHYVTDAGRKWYEIWVPHDPDEWRKPKLVFPDIAESPRFFVDFSGAVVNGDCYWITLRERYDPDWLMLMLAVANSTFIERFYDIAFHNKLYAGRRRFMTQFVKSFPVPNPMLSESSDIIRRTQKLVRSPRRASELEAELDDLVWQAFGLTKEC